MKNKLSLFFLLVFSQLLLAQKIERNKINLPEISPIKSELMAAKGWVLQDDGRWLSEDNKIGYYNFEQNRNPNPQEKLGKQNFEKIELRDVLIGDKQYAVLTIFYEGGQFEFPDLKENFKKTQNARFYVFKAEKLIEMQKAALLFNVPTAINLDVFCTSTLINYNKKKLNTQIAYTISRVEQIEEPSQFTLIMAIMPIIVNGEKLLRFRYIHLFNQQSIYQKYLLPANKDKLFERSYFEVPYNRFTRFLEGLSVFTPDFNLETPQDYADYIKRGKLRYKRANYSGALSDFRDAIKLMPDTNDWLLYALMGSSLHETGDYNGAIRAFDKAIMLEPIEAEQHTMWVKNYYNRGLSKLRLNQKNEACTDFSQAQNLGLSDEEALKVIKKNCKKRR